MIELSDLLQNYDWKEAISAGIGVGVGAIHAVYNTLSFGSSPKIIGEAASFVAATMYTVSEKPLRCIGNGAIGLVFYEIGYSATNKLLNH